MTSDDDATQRHPTSVELELELPHPPEKVWRALTDPALVSEWLLPVFGLRLEPGATFAFRTDPHPGWDGAVRCRLLEAEAPHRLSYTWSVPGMDTVVTFTLSPSSQGTRLALVQSGFGPTHKRELGGARYGWKLMGDRLVELLGRLA